MTFLTIFSAPKAFTDPHIATIQHNAIQSWKHCDKDVQVLLIGDEPGLEEAATTLGVTHLTDVRRNRWGTPLISSIFELGRTHSESPLLAYVNADIILLPNFATAARKVVLQSERFLMVGRRWDLDVRRAIEYGPDWVVHFQTEVHKRGRLHPPAGSDYFIFPRDGFSAIPDFAVGRAGWDNWMIYHACNLGWDVIDATADVMVIHQDHDYRHLPDGKPHYNLQESDLNRQLAGGKASMFILLDANKRLVDGTIWPQRPSLVRMLRKIEVWLTPPVVKPRGLRWGVARRLRRTWKKLLT